MTKKKSGRERGASQVPAGGRRQFLEGMALSAGALAFLAGAGSSRSAQAQSSAPPPRPGLSLPPAPTVAQPAPLKDVAGKTAYITASADGIGLGIARACSNAGMKVVIGYRNEARLADALPLFRPGNAGVHAIKHDVTDRDGWVRLLAEIKASSAICTCWSTMQDRRRCNRPVSPKLKSGTMRSPSISRPSTTASRPACPTSRPMAKARIS